MKKLIFDYNNFFGSGHFLIHQIWKNRLKNSRSQKSCCNQKSVFSCKSTTQRNFWNPFTPVMYSCNFFPVLLMATSIPGVEKFSWKSVCEVFFNELNWNFRVAPKSETIGFVLFCSRSPHDLGLFYCCRKHGKVSFVIGIVCRRNIPTCYLVAKAFVWTNPLPNLLLHALLLNSQVCRKIL